MAEFTSSPQVSPTPNQLFNPLMAGQQQQQQNQLQMQQLDLTAADHEQVGRLAAGLLNIQDPAARADAYTRGVGMLQSQGLAKYAPPTLPDEGSLRMLVSQSVPVANQITSGLYTPPGLTDALTASRAPLPGQPGYGGTTAPGVAGTPSMPIPQRGTGGPGASASAPTAWLPYFAEASKETGIPVDLLIAQARQESGFNPNATGQAGELGVFQIKPSTAANPGGGMAGVDPASITGPDNVRNNIMFGAQYLKSRMGNGDPNNPAVQAAGLHAYNGGGDPNYVANVFRYRPTAAPSDPNAAVTAYTPGAAAAPTTTATAQPGATPPSTQFAGPGAPTLPPAATEAPPGPTQPPGATAAPAQPGQPQPAPAPTAAQAPTAQPTATPPTGVQSPQFQAALELNRRAAALETQFPNSPAAKAQAAALRAQAALYMQADSVVKLPDGTYLHTLTGAPESAPTVPAHFVWDPNQGAFVDTTGTHPPVTPPSPRITMAPGGTAIQSKPGGGATVVYQAPAGAVQTQSAAQAAGTAAGTAAGKLVPQLAEQGTRANQAIITIDEGLHNIQKAQEAGVSTGYFAPWITTGLAMAKSLGVDTKALAGVDPSAVGDIQTAKKTLGLVSGQILQQILGPESQVTEGKIQQFIGATPGIETDPYALQRVLNWARSQFVYEREQAAQGMEDARAPGAGGILQPDWLPNYYATKGFGPIYNPTIGGMQQPDGQAPGREPPPPPPAQQTTPASTPPPKALSSLIEGHVTTFSNGQQWTLRNGQPVQVKK